MSWSSAPGYLIVRKPKGSKTNCKKEEREVVQAFRTSSEVYASKVYAEYLGLQASPEGYEYGLYKEVKQ